MSEKTIASQLASQRKIITSTCAHCGQIMRGLRIKKYCNGKCRQAAYYERVRQSRTEPTAQGSGRISQKN